MDDLLWTIASARIILGAAANIQAPPNLSPGTYPSLIAAGINDWGGISPVTPDHVNPEAPWPAIATLADKTASMGKVLVQRLPAYPAYLRAPRDWFAPRIATALLRASDAAGFARGDDWSPGALTLPRLAAPLLNAADAGLAGLVERAAQGERLDTHAIETLFAARDADQAHVMAAADRLRQAVAGDTVRYVVNRNINYTNICTYRCSFCAFSKGKTHEALRGPAYDLDHTEITRRAKEAWARGATEVCLQGGIHPEYTGATYEAICRAIKQAVPGIHIHAFSALEIHQGAHTLGLSLSVFLARLRDAGLGTLPGTAAEILDDEIRAIICPDKVNTEEWQAVMRAAHGLGLRSTATIMFGHLEAPLHWARHLLVLRDLQAETGGFTEFVPLPFVHMEAPMYLRGLARRGPSFREALLMHSVARLVLHPHFSNIQTSWVKMGPEGAAMALQAGANDLGGTLMNESISRAAGTEHGQEFPPEAMERLILSIGRQPMQRSTTYATVEREREQTSRIAAPLAPMVQTVPRKRVLLAGD